MIVAVPLTVTDLDKARLAGILYAVLDACDAPVRRRRRRAGSLAVWGESEETFADIAPYLMKVETTELLDWILAFSATDAWCGIPLLSPLSLDEVQTHVRRF